MHDTANDLAALLAGLSANCRRLELELEGTIERARAAAMAPHGYGIGPDGAPRAVPLERPAGRFAATVARIMAGRPAIA